MFSEPNDKESAWKHFEGGSKNRKVSSPHLGVF